MHLTIIAAGFLSVMFPFAEELIIVVFLGLKTIVDLRTHESMHQKDKPGILLIQ